MTASQRNFLQLAGDKEGAVRMGGSVVIVDPFSSGALYAPLLRQRGYGVIAVFSQENTPAFLLKSYRPDDFAAVVTFGGTFDGTVKTLAEDVLSAGSGNTPLAVIPGTESGVALAEELAAFWNLPSNPSNTSALRRNKFLMNKHLAACGIPAVRQKLCERTEDALLFYDALCAQNAAAAMIVKPTDSCGTDGVRLVRSTAEIEQYFREYHGARNILGQPIERIVAQEYLQGTEFVVDAVSLTSGGRTEHFVTNVCQYKKERANGSDFVYREMRFVEIDQFPQVCAYAKQVLDALDFRCGASHCELMLTDKGPILIEIAGRIHGGFGPKIVEECSSHSLLNLSLDSYVAPQDFIAKTKTNKDTAAARLIKHAVEHFFINTKKGTVASIHHKKEIEQLPSYFYGVWNTAEGKPIAPTVDLGNAPCWIILVHQSKEQLDKDQAFLLDLERANKIFDITEASAEAAL